MHDFKQAMSGANVVFIVGTGLSALATGGAKTATWAGLINSGADRAQRLSDGATDQWRELVDLQLALGTTQTTIQAAGLVAAELKRLGRQAFRDWLAEDVGALVPMVEDATKALLDYPFPILTTNYDTLIEQIGGRQGCDWTEVDRFQEVAALGSESIGHLHGVWDNPDSIVLTEADYTRLRAHSSTQALERAFSSIKTIVYVGFGAGLSDPNFSELLAWQRDTFPESRVRHFRLCRTAELPDLQRLHAPDNVTPVAYGEDYADLAFFLRESAPSKDELALNRAGLAMDITQDARTDLLESISRESVLVDAGAADLAEQDIVISPVLLPLAHANFVKEKLKRGKNSKVERVNAADEVLGHDFFVIVGDEGSGLTTSVKWIAAKSSEVLGAAPVFVRFDDCKYRRYPLATAVKNAARLIGLVESSTASVPAHILAIDDFRPNVRNADALLGEALSSEAAVIVIGCRQGDEDTLVSKLRQLSVTPRVLYQGRLRHADIAALAEKVAPGRGGALADEAVRVLDAEGLRRTPMTVSLILFLLLQGMSQDLISLTGILDAYATLLLKIGDPHADVTGLSDSDMQAVLSNLAEYMIWEERASLSPAEVQQHIESVLAKYGWSGSGKDVLDYLLKRRVLQLHLGMVEFSRYSYLTLFAAKRAMVDKEFRARITGDLFYYEPVAVKLAALSPADEELLARLAPLLQDALALSVDQGSPYEVMPSIVVAEVPESPAVAGSAQATSEAQHLESEEPRPSISRNQELELPDPSATGRFGLVREEMTVTAQLQRLARLASSLVRDLGQVEDLELKKESLVATLELWGRLVASMSADPELADLKEAISQHLREDEHEFDPDKAEQAVDFLIRSIPAGSVLAGVELYLRSPKLNSLLNEAYEAGLLSQTQELVTAATMLYVIQKPDGWTTRVAGLINGAEPTWILTHFLQSILEDAYVQSSKMDPDLLSLCKTVMAKSHAFANSNVRSAYLNKYGQHLNRLRAQQYQSEPTDSAA